MTRLACHKPIFMIKFLPLLISLAFLSTPAANQQPSLPAFVKCSDTPWKGFVFIIPIEKRSTKKEVEKLNNWECLGMADKITVRPGPGIKQACQLIVDEKDTYTQPSGARLLKPGIRIIAGKKGDFYFVSELVSTNNYPFIIHNEEEQGRESD
jgi:hypothetical protein